MPGLVTRTRAPVADDRRRDPAARGFEGLPPAVDAVARLQPVPRPGQVPHGLVSQPEQVLDREPGPGHLVDGDARQVPGDVGLHDHGGHPGRQAVCGRGGGQQRRDDDDACHGLLSEPVDRLGDTGAVELLQGDDADAVPRVPGGALDAEQGGRGAVEDGVEADHADHARAPPGQAAGQRVGAVVELLDGHEHALSGLVAHARVVVEHPGHRLVRDPGEAGDVVHHRRAGGRLLAHGDSPDGTSYRMLIIFRRGRPTGRRMRVPRPPRAHASVVIGGAGVRIRGPAGSTPGSSGSRRRTGGWWCPRRSPPARCATSRPGRAAPRRPRPGTARCGAGPRR